MDEPTRTRSFGHDGLTFDVRTGGPDSGEVVVLLHGFPQDATSYERIEPALHAAGYRTLAPDQRGYSPGASPRSVPRYQLKHLVGDVLAIAEEAGARRIHLVGHDWGAVVAWEVARRHPDRVLTLTALSVAHPRATVAAARRGAQLVKSAYIAVFQVPFLVEGAWLAAGLASGLRRAGLPERFAERYGRRFGTLGALWGPLAWYRALPLAPFDRAGRRASAQVRVPTTFVWGNRDAYVDRSAAELTATFVDGDYRFVELDADHWLPEKEPDALVPLILDRLRGGPTDLGVHRGITPPRP